MMKEICAQCLQPHVDPATGKTTYVFSCFNQDQPLDQVDFPPSPSAWRRTACRRSSPRSGSAAALKKLPPPDRAQGGLTEEYAGGGHSSWRLLIGWWCLQPSFATVIQARQGYGGADIDVQLKTRPAPGCPAAGTDRARLRPAYEKAVLTSGPSSGLRLAAPRADERFRPEPSARRGMQKLIRAGSLTAAEGRRQLPRPLSQADRMEEQLQFARSFYNRAVKQYVQRVTKFPRRPVARFFNFTSRCRSFERPTIAAP
jgi:hypothetical protein